MRSLAGAQAMANVLLNAINSAFVRSRSSMEARVGKPGISRFARKRLGAAAQVSKLDKLATRNNGMMLWALSRLTGGACFSCCEQPSAQ